MDSDSESEYSDQERPIVSETKEGQVQEVVSEDQEELGLVLNAGVVDETLIQDTVLTPQRNNLESEHSGSS